MRFPGRARKSDVEGDPPGAGDPAPWGRIDLWITLGVTLLGAVLRLVYLTQIDTAENPFFEEPTMDSRLYDGLAQGYASGDWIGDGVYWYSPLYPYFVALFYSVVGRDFTLLIGLQLLLGGVHCGVVYGLGRQLFDRPAALCGALLLATYRIAFFYEGLLLKAGLAALLFDVGLLVLLLAAHRVTRADTSRTVGLVTLAGAGVIVGLGALTAGTLIVIGAWGAVWLLGRVRSSGASWSAALVPSLAFVGGVALVILPVTARNWLVASDLVLVSYNAGPVFYTGNCPYNPNGSQIDVGSYLRPANPLEHASEREEAFFVDYASAESGRELAPSEVNAFWFGKGLEWVTENPGRFVALTAKKVLVFFNDYEIPNNQSFDLFAEKFSWLLRVPVFPTFGVLAGLGLTGMVLCGLGRRPGTLLLLGAFWLYAFSIIFNFVVSRYRFPVTGLLCLLSGFALVEIVNAFRERRIRAASLPLAGAVALVLLLHLPLSGFDRDLSDGHRMLAQAYLRTGDEPRAEANFHRATEINPRSFTAFRELGMLQLQDAQRGAPDARERFEKARTNFEQSVKTCPSLPERQISRYLLALACLGAGDGEAAAGVATEGLNEGEDCRLYFARSRARAKARDVAGEVADLEAALAQQPSYPDALLHLGRLRAAGNAPEEALELYYRILDTIPDDPRALGEILLLLQPLKEAGQHDAVVAWLRRGTERPRPAPGVLNELAWFLATTEDRGHRDLAAAEELARRALTASPNHAPYLDTLAEIQFARGERAEALRTIERAIAGAGEDADLLTYLEDQRRRFTRGRGETP